MKNRGKSFLLSALIALAPMSASADDLYSVPKYQPYSLTESVELNNLLNKKTEFSWNGEFSLNTFLRQFFPYLNNLNNPPSIGPGFELKLTPTLSLEATICGPITPISLEGQKPRIGIYLNFKLK